MDLLRKWGQNPWKF